MCRSCSRLDRILPELIDKGRLKNLEIRLYCDNKLLDDFLAFLEGDRGDRHQHEKKHRLGRAIIVFTSVLLNQKQRDIYTDEDKVLRVTAMKFKDHSYNDRIYCKEYQTGKIKRIVMCSIYFDKKTTKLKHKERSEIERVGQYEYAFED